MAEDLWKPCTLTRAGHGKRAQALPLHSGLIVQLVLVHILGSALSQWLPEALEDAVPLLQRQLQILLQRERTQLVRQPAG